MRVNKSGMTTAFLTVLALSVNGQRGGGDNNGPGCCYGSDSSCLTNSMTTCERLSDRKGCEWRAGEDADCTLPTADPADPTEPVDDSVGCCVGPADENACWTNLQSTCEGRIAVRAGCLWLTFASVAEADCTFVETTPEPVGPSCCYTPSNNQKCWTNLQSTCERNAARADCQWLIGEVGEDPATFWTEQCVATTTETPETEAPVFGCCVGSDGAGGVPSACMTNLQSTCEKRAGVRAGCEWREFATIEEAVPGCTWSTDEPEPTDEPEVGCCVTATNDNLCWTNLQSTCERNAPRADCVWTVGTMSNLPDCTNGVTDEPEVGCCYTPSDDTDCWTNLQTTCERNIKNKGADCEWRVGTMSDLPDCKYALSVECGGDGECQSTVFDCPAVGDCSITCEGGGACFDITVNCPENDMCEISCFNTDGVIGACLNAKFNWSATPGLGSLLCEGADACEGVTSFPPTSAQQKMAFEEMLAYAAQPASLLNESMLLLAGACAVIMALATAFYVFSRKSKAVTASWEDEE